MPLSSMRRKEFGVPLSGVLENALCNDVRKMRAERWRAENRGAFDSYAEVIERDGVFSEDLRSF